MIILAFLSIIIFRTIVLNNQLWFSKEQLILKVEFIEDDDKFTDGIDYKVKSYQVNKTVLSENCSVQINDGKLRQHTFIPERRVFQGNLTVVQQEGLKEEATKSFPFRIDLTAKELRKSDGRGIELLDGNKGFGKNLSYPDFSYQVNNASLIIDSQQATLIMTAESESPVSNYSNSH